MIRRGRRTLKWKDWPLCIFAGTAWEVQHSCQSQAWTWQRGCLPHWLFSASPGDIAHWLFAGLRKQGAQQKARDWCYTHASNHNPHILHWAICWALTKKKSLEHWDILVVGPVSSLVYATTRRLEQSYTPVQNCPLFKKGFHGQKAIHLTCINSTSLTFPWLLRFRNILIFKRAYNIFQIKKIKKHDMWTTQNSRHCVKQ